MKHIPFTGFLSTRQKRRSFLSKSTSSSPSPSSSPSHLQPIQEKEEHQSHPPLEKQPRRQQIPEPQPQSQPCNDVISISMAADDDPSMDSTRSGSIAKSTMDETSMSLVSGSTSCPPALFVHAEPSGTGTARTVGKATTLTNQVQKKKKKEHENVGAGTLSSKSRRKKSPSIVSSRSQLKSMIDHEKIVFEEAYTSSSSSNHQHHHYHANAQTMQRNNSKNGLQDVVDKENAYSASSVSSSRKYRPIEKAKSSASSNNIEMQWESGRRIMDNNSICSSSHNSHNSHNSQKSNSNSHISHGSNCSNIGIWKKVSSFGESNSSKKLSGSQTTNSTSSACTVTSSKKSPPKQQDQQQQKPPKPLQQQHPAERPTNASCGTQSASVPWCGSVSSSTSRQGSATSSLTKRSMLRQTNATKHQGQPIDNASIVLSADAQNASIIMSADTLEEDLSYCTMCTFINSASDGSLKKRGGKKNGNSPPFFSASSVPILAGVPVLHKSQSPSGRSIVSQDNNDDDDIDEDDDDLESWFKIRNAYYATVKNDGDAFEVRQHRVKRIEF